MQLPGAAAGWFPGNAHLWQAGFPGKTGPGNRGRRPYVGVMVHRGMSTWVIWWYVGVQRLCR